MANKAPVQGTVEAVNAERGSFKVDGKWYSRAHQSNTTELPAVGSTISFDAYGQQYNIWYRYSCLGGGKENGSNGFTQPAPAAQPGSGPARSVGAAVAVAGCKAAALTAAATLLQGSEGNVTDVAANVIVVAKAFESYLTNAQQETEGMI